MTTAPPSRDPANDDSLIGMLREVLDKFLQGVDDMLPARVVAFDRASNRAQVQPMIRLLTTAGQFVSRAQIASVPVLQIGGGGFVLNFNLLPGDLGWIKASDRDISLYLQGMAESGPNTRRKHSFEDGLFIPHAMTDVTIAAEDAEHPVFQTTGGETCVALWPTFAKVRAARGLVVADTECEGDPNAVFDVRSTVKAAMPWPRMTQAQRDAIPDPVEGMAVWNLDTHSLNTFNGTAWS